MALVNWLVFIFQFIKYGTWSKLLDNLLASINQINSASFLEQVFISAISVSSLEEFAQLVNSNLPESD
ncbi:hypothetical protein NIES19_59770 (plasmid) [Anabaena cylindrica PCC 7122]|nr:hypothetical protein NIES19_59770 [Anabaena cylindrica PCC 7122]